MKKKKDGEAPNDNLTGNAPAPTEESSEETKETKKPETKKDKAEERILKAEADKAEAILTAQRLQAEFDNYRKRNATLRIDSVDEGARNAIAAMLPVLDNFDLAIQNAGDVNEEFLKGIVLIKKQFLDALEKLGLSEIEAEGKFDPNLHDAVVSETVEGVENGTILAVLQKGYKVNDRIIRHTMVKVAE